MKYLETNSERKSAIITSVIMLLLPLLLVECGMQYMDPPPESGIAVNFGTTDYGKGDVQPMKPILSEDNPESEATENTKTEEVVEEEVEETTEAEVAETIEEVVEESTAEESPEEVMTAEDSEVLKQQQKEAEEKAKAEAEAAKKAAAEAAKKKAAEEAAKKKAAEEAAKKAKLDQMMGGLNKQDGEEPGGEGDDNKPGDKGQIDGDPYANAYYGNGQGNGGVGFGLNGRSRESYKKFEQDCNEEGRIVVKIFVNKQGIVTKAEYQAKGSSASDSCLIGPAEKTAKSYRWNVDKNAPNSQIGFVVVNFSLN